VYAILFAGKSYFRQFFHIFSCFIPLLILWHDYLLPLEGVSLTATENEDLTIAENFLGDFAILAARTNVSGGRVNDWLACRIFLACLPIAFSFAIHALAIETPRARNCKRSRFGITCTIAMATFSSTIAIRTYRCRRRVVVRIGV